MQNTITKFGLDSLCTKLILEGKTDNEIYLYIKKSHSNIPIQSIKKWRKEVMKSIKEEEEKNRRKYND
jgi:hypothetical protein